jgi:predicted ribosome quality control (RQC) complex YloA/Tae2 family protein
MLEIKKDEYIFRLGRNAKENFELIDDSLDNDWWFHLDSYPSGHCVISHEKLEIFEITLEQKLFAGNLIKDHSKYKNEKNFSWKIVFTKIKNIVKTKTIGMVKLKEVDGFFII